MVQRFPPPSPPVIQSALLSKVYKKKNAVCLKSNFRGQLKKKGGLLQQTNEKCLLLLGMVEEAGEIPSGFLAPPS